MTITEGSKETSWEPNTEATGDGGPWGTMGVCVCRWWWGGVHGGPWEATGDIQETTEAAHIFWPQRLKVKLKTGNGKP